MQQILNDIPVAQQLETCGMLSKCIKSIRSTKQVDEGAMRLHVERIKDHLESKDIETVKWIPTDKMLADPLTKMKADSSNLTNLLRTGTWKRPA